MVSLHDIRRVLRGNISLGEPLAAWTSLGIGGPADYLLEPHSKEDVVAAVGFFHRQGVPLLILSRASNLLIAERGFRGAAVTLDQALGGIRQQADGTVEVDAGARLPAMVEFCLERSWAGAESLAGLPGTLGGALVQNTGSSAGTIAEHLLEVEVFRQGRVVRLARGGEYHRSGSERDFILSARFRFDRGEKERLLRRRREMLIARNALQPLNLRNAARMFKDPPEGSAAAYIERAGLRGARRGGAMISELHANVVVNSGGASAADVLALLRRAQRTVRGHSGIGLELAVKLIGFERAVLREVA